MTAPVRPVWRRLLMGAAVGVCAAEFLATHLPGDHLPHVGTSDKTLHAIAYFVLGGVVWATLAAYGLARRKRLGLLLLLLPLYAVIDEITQPLFGRYSEPSDWLADMGGAAAAIALLELTLLVVRRVRTSAD